MESTGYSAPRPNEEQDFVMLESVSHAPSRSPVTALATSTHPQQDNAVMRAMGRPIYIIGETPVTKEYEILSLLTRKYYFAEYEEPAMESSGAEYKFDWSQQEELAAGDLTKLRDAQKQYLDRHLTDLMDATDDLWLLWDVSHCDRLLFTSDQRLPFDIRGHVDFAIVDRVAKKYQNALAGLRLVVQIERHVQDDDDARAHAETQALLALIASDVKSPERVAPVVLLTNLTDFWCFLWFGKEQQVVKFVLNEAKHAMELVTSIVQEFDWHEEGFEIPFVEEYDDDHHRKLVMEDDL